MNTSKVIIQKSGRGHVVVCSISNLFNKTISFRVSLSIVSGWLGKRISAERIMEYENEILSIVEADLKRKINNKRVSLVLR